ncbi:PAS domain-containing protein [Cyanobium sp. FACHB-13342]|uniref:PAS domain-containing protein n=1 Tax=Cyanobium sp. FACHB-13342 TaxID=2692793 RepID=UPI001680611F|nr:PAS domain-containing protein [Cyanobium sp. FACHB-13342]MBD2423082.1 PAS domain-containing protein [Cyanobium sp. FACHB-13342]
MTPPAIPASFQALQLTENFPVGAYVFYRDPVTQQPSFSFFSNRLLEMLDLTREELDANPMNAYRSMHPDDIDAFFKASDEAVRNQTNFINESRYIIRGQTRWYRLDSCSRQLPDGQTVWDGAVIDITEQRTSLEEANKALQLTESIPVGTYVLLSPREGPQRYSFLSRRFLEMTGLDPDKLKQDFAHYFSIVHPDDREAAIAHNIAGAAALEPYTWEGRWLQNGNVKWISIESVPRRLPTGEVAWEGVFIDFTTRKQAEQQLIEAKERFHNMINHLPIPVATTLTTPEREVIFVNLAFTQTFGYTQLDCPTMADWARCAYPDEAYRKAVFDEFDAEVTASVQENRMPRPLEYRVTCKNGQVRDVLINCLVVEGMLYGSFLDITEQRQAEAELAKAWAQEREVEAERSLQLNQKLKTSLTAAAAAHEIQQPLSAILLNCQMAMESLQELSPNQLPALLQDSLRRLTLEGERVVTTVERMRMLLRNVESDQNQINLSINLDSALVYLKNELKPDQLNLRVAGLDQPCWIHGDGAQLQMAVVNLIRNAVQATDHLPLANRHLLVQLIKSSNAVEVRVGDSGPGFPDEFDYSRSWELLKSTKITGMGIGLFVAQTAATNHRGQLRIGRSAELGGAEVALELPLNAST